MAISPDSKTAGHEFPFKQLAILLVCRLVEPLAQASITPYAFFMIKDIAPELSNAQATSFLTIVYSTYSFAQFGTNLAWGRISDYIGRRPAMLCGLAAITIGSFGLAFAQNKAAVLLFRLIPGLLSGNVVIVRTMIGDIVHTPQHRARAFAWNQTVYQTGYVLGPLLGGYLARPCFQYKGLCKAGYYGLFERFPYSGPNLVIAVVGLISFSIALLFMKETLPKKGSELVDPEESTDSEESPLLPERDQQGEPRKQSLRDVMSTNVCHLILNYAIMAMHTICFDQIFPVFLATPQAKSTFPFWMSGGLGLGANTVATFMSSAGILSIALMIILFPPVDSRFGSLSCMRASLFLYPVTYLLLPYIVAIPDSPRWPQIMAVIATLLLKTTAAVFSFNDSSILLSEAAPSQDTLGLINGTAQTAAAAARALGPVIMGFCISLGEKSGIEPLGWWFLAIVAVVGIIQVYGIRRPKALG